MEKRWILVLTALIMVLVPRTAWADDASEGVEGSKTGPQLMTTIGWNFENGNSAEKDLEKEMQFYQTAKTYYNSVGDADRSVVLGRMIDKARREQRGDYRVIANQNYSAIHRDYNAESARRKGSIDFWKGLMIMLAASVGTMLSNKRNAVAQTSKVKEDKTPEWLQNLEKEGNTTEGPVFCFEDGANFIQNGDEPAQQSDAVQDEDLLKALGLFEPGDKNQDR